MYVFTPYVCGTQGGRGADVHLAHGLIASVAHVAVVHVAVIHVAVVHVVVIHCGADSGLK